ncbi:MAG: rod shape-determining protein RodA, partial [Bacteroidales bacterium]
MKRKINVWVNMDWFTMILYLTLIIIGWVTIYSAVYNEEHQSIFDFSQRYGKQIIWIAAALLLAFFVVIIESHFYSFFAFPLYAIFIFLLVLVLFAGHEVHGSRAWLQFGSVRFQPAEFAKIGTALFLSKYLSNLDLTSASFKEYLKIILLIIFPTLLISGQDAGTALVFLAFL